MFVHCKTTNSFSNKFRIEDFPEYHCALSILIHILVKDIVPKSSNTQKKAAMLTILHRNPFLN